MRIIESKSLDKDLMFIFIMRSETYPTTLPCSKALCGCGTWEYSLMLIMVLGLQLDSMTLQVIYSLKDSVFRIIGSCSLFQR